jgi:hypothetical protein
VLVEGESDRVALEVLAGRRGQDLAAAGVAIESIGGAHSIGRVLRGLEARDPAPRILGLYDAGEESAVRRALEAAGHGSALTRPDLERLGFFACEADLEDELIRALGVAEVERVIAEQGELQSLRILQRQPAQRGRSVVAQLSRFIGTRSGRKAKYAEALANAVEAAQIPRPLARLLDLLQP